MGALLTAALLALPCSGDWLVTRDGARIETAGPWKVKGNQVIFTQPNGTLSSLRASEIDLDASAVATAQAQVPPPPPVAEGGGEKTRPKPVLVLTDKDVRRAAGAPAASGEPGGGQENGGEPGAAETAPGGSTSAVEVVGWQTRDSAEGDGLELYGTLRNNGGAIASSIELVVQLNDAAGKALLQTSAFLGSPTLTPGSATTFRALLPGITSVTGEPRFEIKSNEITLAPAKPLPEGEEESEAESEAGSI